MSRLLAAPLPLWPEGRLQAALAALASGGTAAAPTSGTPPAYDLDPVEVAWASLPRSLPVLAPAVLTLAAPCPGHLVLLAASRWRGVTLLAPDGNRSRLRASRLVRALRTLQTAAEDLGAAAIDSLLSAPPLDRLSPAARRRARHALLAAQLAAAPGLRAHLAMAKPGSAASESRQGPRHPGPPLAPLLRRAAALAAAILARQALSWLAWLTLGGAVLASRIDAATELTWALLCLSLPAARALELAAANGLASRIALRLRRRLFAATLALAPAVLRADGIGRLLGRLLAIESCEASLVAAAPTAGLALAELAGAAAALGQGTAPASHLALLAAAAVAAGLLAIHRARAERGLAAGQRDLTGQLVEALAGHRTLRAQGPRAEPTTGLTDHHAQLRALAARELRLRTLLPRAWLLAGLGALAAASSGTAPPPEALALSLGGLLLAQDALARLAAGLGHLATAWTASQEILPLLAATRAAAPPAAVPPAAAPPTDSASRAISSPTAPAASHLIPPHPPGALLLEARHLTCRLPGAPAPLLDAASLAIRPGDRILLTGPSGAGKSTLAALLAAHRPPDSGLLLLDGYDLSTLGTPAWRHRVVAVPQLHANHLFAGSLAWNLLLGRAWPPTPRDLALAADLCRDLGLGDLLDRLPAGLDQPIGEAGWQLSDGEAARVCLARALLQEPDLLILDESLGALDPALRLQVLATLDRRARTLLLIGHPDLDTA